MFDLFKSRPTDIKGVRNALLQFMKEQLQKAAGGEGSGITGLYLFIDCREEDKFLYESALYFAEEDKFKMEEVQRIVDDYAIALPADWKLALAFTQEIPPEATRAKNIDAALLISTFNSPLVVKNVAAYINVLNGVAAKTSYIIQSGSAKINIGRGTSVQTASGFFRKNTIAFTDDEANAPNRAVSRQHAHIEWDGSLGSFFLFADEGGIPPSNKIKVRSQDGDMIKLMTTQIGHRLAEGDQMILGDAVVLEFTYLAG